jgi:hypothetical protein
MGENKLDSLDIEDDRVVYMKNNIDNALLELLQLHSWSFAVKSIKLDSPLVGIKIDNFTYTYVFPDDLILFIGIVENGNYEIQGRNIGFNSNPMTIKYTAIPEDDKLYSFLFLETLTRSVVVKSIVKVSDKENLFPISIQIYEDTKLTALNQDGYIQSPRKFRTASRYLKEMHR